MSRIRPDTRPSEQLHSMARSHDRELWLILPWFIRFLLIPGILVLAICLDLLTWAVSRACRARWPVLVSLTATLAMCLWFRPSFGWAYVLSAATTSLEESDSCHTVACVELTHDLSRAMMNVLRCTGMLIASWMLVVQIIAMRTMELFLAWPRLAATACFATMLCSCA